MMVPWYSTRLLCVEGRRIAGFFSPVACVNHYFLREIRVSRYSQITFTTAEPLLSMTTPSLHVDTLNDASVLQRINQANLDLETTLEHITEMPDFEENVLAIAHTIVDTVNLNADLSLASILLNQQASIYPVRHCIDTAVVSMLVAQRLKKAPDVILTITAAALTMNVGMLQQQKQFQVKQSALTEDDRKVIHDHPQEGVTMLQAAGITNADWLACVKLHHENEDGSGYPDGKKNFEISQNAKIIAIADRYCARVSSREYRKSLQPDAAVRDMMLSEKKNINPILAACFTQVLGIYPIGTQVRLKNGEVAMVTGRGPTPSTPMVHALKGTSGQILAHPVVRDTRAGEWMIAGVMEDGLGTVKFSLLQLWGKAARV